MNSPSTQWFYAKDGSQAGPVSQSELADLVASGQIPASTLVWREGMDEWMAADQVDGFLSMPEPVTGRQGEESTPENEEFSPYSPPAASSEIPVAPVATSGPQIRPWVRFWARTIDIIIVGFSFGMILGFLAPSALDSLDMVLNLLVLLVSTVVLAASFAVFGSTPGKALFRISIRNADGTKLSFLPALARELKVYAMGMGLGIPLVALITQITAYSRLTSDGITSWDRGADLVVTHQTIGALRWILITAFLLAGIALISYGNSLE